MCVESNRLPGRDPTSTDGGTRTDGSVTPTDVPVRPTDVGMLSDTGPTTRDGGVSTDVQVTINGNPRSRGCACHAGPAHLDARTTMLGVLFGLCAVARRRRRQG